MASSRTETRDQSVTAHLQGLLSQAQRVQRDWLAAGLPGRHAALGRMADAIRSHTADIVDANRQDVEQAHQEAMAPSLLKRLALDGQALEGLAQALDTLQGLPDPLGRGRGLRTLPNGLRLEAVTVPLGVIALIYESRPGVTIETAGLAIKTGNALILRGGREALGTNRMLHKILTESLTEAGLAPDLLQLVGHTDRAYVDGLMHLEGLDLLIPRGGSGLIQHVKQYATVPVIETGVGNCHIYVDRAANLDMAARIVLDAKVGNPAVCNAAETLLVHGEIAAAFLPRLESTLKPFGVRLHADPLSMAHLTEAVLATEEDFAQEYLSLDLAVRTVPSLQDAIDHIGRFGSGHSEAIVTDDYRAGRSFQTAVDAAVVYWNASTRFTDGSQFGLGAEVGISTQKLHARGPMGPEALTTIKTLAWGEGQTRDL